jgi:acetoin utilization protein AcuB
MRASFLRVAAGASRANHYGSSGEARSGCRIPVLRFIVRFPFAIRFQVLHACCRYMFRGTAFRDPGASMQVKDYMTTRLVTVEMDDTLASVREIFEHTGFHHLLVVDDGAVVGVLSDRDLLRHLSPYVGTAAETQRDAATLNKHVHQVMARHPVTLTPESELAEVLEKFRHKDVTCLPVVDAHGKVVGIVTWRDMLKLMGEVLLPAVPADGQTAD